MSELKEAFKKLTPVQRQTVIDQEAVERFRNLLKVVYSIDSIENTIVKLEIEEMQELHAEACAEEELTGDTI